MTYTADEDEKSKWRASEKQMGIYSLVQVITGQVPEKVWCLPKKASGEQMKNCLRCWGITNLLRVETTESAYGEIGNVQA